MPKPRLHFHSFSCTMCPIACKSWQQHWRHCVPHHCPLSLNIIITNQSMSGIVLYADDFHEASLFGYLSGRTEKNVLRAGKKKAYTKCKCVEKEGFALIKGPILAFFRSSDLISFHLALRQKQTMEAWGTWSVSPEVDKGEVGMFNTFREHTDSLGTHTIRKQKSLAQFGTFHGFCSLLINNRLSR